MRVNFGTPPPSPTPFDYASGRLTDRVYISRSFPLNIAASRDYQEPSRIINIVLDDLGPNETLINDENERTVTVLRGIRKQIRFVVTRETGNVREIAIERAENGQLETLVVFDREQADRLITLIRALPFIDPTGDESQVVDGDLLRSILSGPSELGAFYQANSAGLRHAIENDVDARDVLAVAHRRSVVANFRRLLEDSSYFEEEQERCGGPEHVWQELFEASPWILGIGTSGQFLTSWDADKLESIVAGRTIAGPGKRVDALLQTAGAVNAVVFAEIKHHKVNLLGAEYRSGAWQPSSELTGAVTQIQQTVHLARRQLGERLMQLDDDGMETGEISRLLRPRSYLIIGSLSEITNETGGVHPQKFDSFELYRRNLYEPEIVTFDELLARAEWQVARSTSDPEV